MSKVKRAILLSFRLALTCVAMGVAYLLSTMVIGETNVPMTAEEAGQAGIALVFVSSVNALVLSSIILRSPRHGLKLIGLVILVQFGVETLMTQIETLYFNSALRMGSGEFAAIVAAGALRALIFSPLAVLILGKTRKSVKPEEQRATAALSSRVKRFAALAVFYVVVYFFFGYFVAWQWEETRTFYAGNTAIEPFLRHFGDLFLREDPVIIPFQLLRGALWTGLALVIVRMIRASRWGTSLAVALTFAVLLSLPIGLFPNPYMPPMVRQAHFYELASSMLVFGGIAGWVLHTN
ncbi:MAG: hypothetical protein R6X31_10815 [Anaerolineae bacterium]